MSRSVPTWYNVTQAAASLVVDGLGCQVCLCHSCLLCVCIVFRLSVVMCWDQIMAGLR